jgi:pimeloyl-ACP methyl ester carboxylesterase
MADADDIRQVIEHLRHTQSVERLQARAKGAASQGDAAPAVLGIVGVGGGGTAALRYAALHPSDVPFIATISARVSHACALRGTLTWNQIDALKVRYLERTPCCSRHPCARVLSPTRYRRPPLQVSSLPTSGAVGV